MITKANALQSLRPGAEWTIRGNEIEWLDTEQTQPTYEELLNEVVRLTYLEEVNEYQRKRKAEYPSYADYLDGVVKGDQDQIDTYIAACQAVKDKYPKVEVDEAELASRQAQALFDHQLEEYTKAQARLAQYQVALGREEVIELQDAPNPILDSDGSPIYEQIEVVTQTAIDPVEPTIERTMYSDEDPMAEPTIETIENPLITKDNEERAAAQNVINNTEQAVIDHYEANQ